MKASELKIGNFVIDKKTEAVCTVDGIHYPNEDVVTEDKKYDDWFRTITPEPIPLTEEWLLKFGFENKSKYTAYKLNDRWNKRAIHNHRNGLTILIRAGHFTIKSHTLLQIKYVHQLQNLYFAITGEELTIQE